MSPSDGNRRQVLVMCVVVAALSGCATVTEPTTTRTAVAPSAETQITSTEKSAAKPRPWDVGLELRLDVPTRTFAGLGSSWSASFLLTRALGPVRAFAAPTFGWAGCRVDCPGLSIKSRGDDSTLGGLFVHVGLEAGLERRIPLGQWSLELALGVKTSYYHLPLSEGQDFNGERNAVSFGPLASLRIVGPAHELRGGASAQRSRNGPELLVARLTAMGRGASETTWLIGAGWNWRFEGPQ